MLAKNLPDLPKEQLEGEILSVLNWLGEQMPGGCFVYQADEQSRLLYANRATFRIFGCETEEAFLNLTGGTFQGMVFPDDYEEVMDAIKGQIRMEEGRDNDHVEYRIRRQDGVLRWVEDYGHFATMPGYGDVFYVFLNDITEKRAMQQERLQMELALEQEHRVNEMKAAFLFNISHDIRTPMNAVMGYTHLAQAHLDDRELAAKYLKQVEASGSQMLSMLDDLLEMNRMESGRLELHLAPCSLGEQLKMVADLFQAQAEEKQVQLTAELHLEGDGVLADAPRVRRVMGNLLDNAVKFTPAGGWVRLSAKRLQVSQSGFARFRMVIEDSGIGMSRAFMNQMYQAFEREQNSTKAGIIGTGLGLAITKRLLDTMGGTIYVESEKGRGTRVTVELPLRLEGAQAGSPSPVQIPAPVGEGRILVVEDLEMNRMLAEILLEEAGFTVESVEDGSDAVEAVASHPMWYYDLILMDIQMPVMNGYEATRVIRAMGREDTDVIPIIALSANARLEDRRMSLESGMDDHVAKPFDADSLITNINNRIRQRK